MPRENDTRYYFTFFGIFIKLLEKFITFCQLLQILCIHKKMIVSLTYDHLSYFKYTLITYYSFYNFYNLFIIHTIVRSFLGDMDIMRMALLQGCSRDLHESAGLLQGLDILCTAVTHTGTKTAQ